MDDRMPGSPLRAPVLVVFGGSFDPVHNGHLNLARTILDRHLGDEILFVPAGRPPHKAGQELTPGEDRLEMLRLAVEDKPRFSTSDIELTREDGFTYTIDTLTVLAQVFPDHELAFLLGTDSLCDLHKWHRAPELVAHHRLLIYPRPGVRLPAYVELTGRFGTRNAKKLLDSVLEGFPEFDLSATRIRDLLAARRRIEGLCPEAVERYIYGRGLYGAVPSDYY
jgi:nicotinate-nucleotide adenylyltransferase